MYIVYFYKYSVSFISIKYLQRYNVSPSPSTTSSERTKDDIQIRILKLE